MPLNTDHVEDALYHRHRLCVNDVIVSGIVVPKVVCWTGSCHDLTLPGLLELAPPTTLTYLRSLVLAELVEDAVRKLTIRRVVSAVVHGTDLRPVLLELAAEEVVIGRLADLSRSCASPTKTPPAATRSRTRSMPGRSRLAPLCPGSLLPPPGPRSLLASIVY